ncbi:MAG: hypothetical protein E6R13_06105 [Spirochaetes bacterium]|nr:MAG: hypothetical protein E6R13_06105 [Spirochaetota bacterium]
MKFNLSNLVKLNITPDLYFILYCLVNNIDYPWKTEDYDSQIKYLEDNHFISIKDDVIIIRGKTELLFDVQKESLKQEYISNELDWVQEYIDLWPKGIKSGNRLIRPNLTSAKNKLNTFINKYKYSKEDILKATKKYINEFAEHNYKMITCGDYFIEKFGSSLLASYIDNLDSMEDVSTGNYFKLV